MDILARNKLLIRLVYILVFINLLAIASLWWQKSSERKGIRERTSQQSIAIMRERLGLTNEQEKMLSAIREDFFKKEKELSSLIRSQRDSMNMLMFTGNADTTATLAIARRVAENEYRMEAYRVQQAAQVRSLLDPSQLDKLREVSNEIRDFLKPPDRERPKPNS